MLKLIRDWRYNILKKNLKSNLRTPYHFWQEWKNRTLVSFSRFLIRFVCEELNILFGVITSWLNRQILLSYNVKIGSNFQIGPEKIKLFIPLGGRICIGNDVKVYTPIELVTNTINYKEVAILIGNGTGIGHNTSIRAARKVVIGENCLIAPFVTIIDTNAHPLDPDKRLRRERIPDDEIRPVEIGDNVWIGERAVIGPGVKIGNGSIVGANALVIKDVPENTVVVGNPARVASWLKKPEKRNKK